MHYVLFNILFCYLLFTREQQWIQRHPVSCKWGHVSVPCLPRWIVVLLGTVTPFVPSLFLLSAIKVIKGGEQERAVCSLTTSNDMTSVKRGYIFKHLPLDAYLKLPAWEVARCKSQRSGFWERHTVLCNVMLWVVRQWCYSKWAQKVKLWVFFFFFLMWKCYYRTT